MLYDLIISNNQSVDFLIYSISLALNVKNTQRVTELPGKKLDSLEKNLNSYHRVACLRAWGARVMNCMLLIDNITLEDASYFMITSQWLSLELIKKFALLNFVINMGTFSWIPCSPQGQYLRQTDPVSCGHLSPLCTRCTEFAEFSSFFENWVRILEYFINYDEIITKIDFQSKEYRNFPTILSQNFGFATSASGLLDFTQFSRRSVFRFSIFFHLSDFRGANFLVKIQISHNFISHNFPCKVFEPCSGKTCGENES